MLADALARNQNLKTQEKHDIMLGILEPRLRKAWNKISAWPNVMLPLFLALDKIECYQHSLISDCFNRLANLKQVSSLNTRVLLFRKGKEIKGYLSSQGQTRFVDRRGNRQAKGKTRNPS